MPPPLVIDPWFQLVSVGLVWISFHCAGMCGPIVVGLDVAGAAKGLRPARGVLRILSYQGGRMTTLAVFGALAGVVGRGLGAAFTSAGAVLALAFGAGIVATTIVKFLPHRPKPARPTLSLDRTRPRARTLSLSRALRRPSLSDSYGSAWLMGVMLGFLPCMIVAWALGLAALTGSPLKGAAIMMTLVAMTTPMLLGVSLLPRAIPARARALLPRALMLVSATWMVMVGLAGLEVVAHLHLHVGDEYVVMLW